MTEATQVVDADPVNEVKSRLPIERLWRGLVDEIARLNAKLEKLQENSDIAGAEHTALCDAVASQV